MSETFSPLADALCNGSSAAQSAAILDPHLTAEDVRALAVSDVPMEEKIALQSVLLARDDVEEVIGHSNLAFDIMHTEGRTAGSLKYLVGPYEGIWAALGANRHLNRMTYHYLADGMRRGAPYNAGMVAMMKNPSVDDLTLNKLGTGQQGLRVFHPRLSIPAMVCAARTWKFAAANLEEALLIRHDDTEEFVAAHYPDLAGFPWEWAAAHILPDLCPPGHRKSYMHRLRSYECDPLAPTEYRTPRVTDQVSV